MVDFLLHHDADILVQDEDGNTPLHVAVENRQTHVVQLLLEDGNPTDLQNTVSTCLYLYVGASVGKDRSKWSTVIQLYLKTRTLSLTVNASGNHILQRKVVLDVLCNDT